MLSLLFFFFKQKTAYELRISDWSSDVCSSDLCHRRRRRHAPPRHHREDSLRSLPAGSQSRKRSGGCRIEMYRSLVTGCGAYLPAQIVTNADLASGSIPPTSGSVSAPASTTATSPPTAR